MRPSTSPRALFRSRALLLATFILMCTSVGRTESSFFQDNIDVWNENEEEAPSDRINGGRPTQRTDYPFFVQRWQGGTFGKFTGCGASLIASKWILTAAHCVHPRSRPTWRLGGWCREDFEAGDAPNCGAHFRIRQSHRVWQHPQYDSSIELYDFALVELKSPVYTIRTVDIDNGQYSSQLQKGDLVRSIGMGWLNDARQVPRLLNEVDNHFMPLDECARRYLGGDRFTDAMMCTDGENKGPCRGDSGSPVLLPQPLHPSGYVQVGIASFAGTRCWRHNNPDVAARVSTAYAWIRNVVCPTYIGPTRTETRHIPGFCQTWQPPATV